MILLPLAHAAAPTASNGSATLNEDGSALITLRATDPEGDAMTYAVVTNPTRGSVTVSGNRATYRPTANYAGADSFTFRARDSGGATSNTATVSLTVTAVNDAPTTASLTSTGAEDTTQTISPTATDVDSTAFTWSIVSAPSQGTATINASTGRITYTPPAHWNGTTSLRFQVSDGAATATGTATIVVTAVNDAPTATSQTVSFTEDGGSLAITLSGNDPESASLTFATGTPPANGAVGLAGRVAVYTPNANFSGTDTFTFTVSDGTAISAPATVTVNVSAVNDPPTAFSAHGMTDGRTVSLQPFSSDPDTTTLTTPTLVTSPAHGSVTYRFGRFRYTPTAGYVGKDRFTWSTSDGTTTATGTFEVSVIDPWDGAYANWSQVGVNNVPFYADATSGGPSTASEVFQGDYILGTFYDLGIETFRQLRSADVAWESFLTAEGALVNADTTDLLSMDEVEPRMTVFDTMYASPTPPWASTPAEFEKAMTPEAYDYLDQVLAEHAAEVRTWEVGNEMFHWSVVQSEGFNPDDHPDLHDSWPLDGYSPEEQAEFLRDASEYIRAGDPDAVIVLSSVLGDSSETEDWLTRVVDHTGSDWFDVVTWHAYDEWDVVYQDRLVLTTFLESLGLEDKLLHLTEVGSSADPLLNSRTDYPNSEATQASDVFRYLIPALAAGNAHVTWHTYRELSTVDDGNMAGLALFEYGGAPRDAAFAMQLLTARLLPAIQVTDLSSGSVYQFDVQSADGSTHRVVWGSGTMTTPSGMTAYTSVVPSSSGTYTWSTAGSTLTLSDTPILLR